MALLEDMSALLSASSVASSSGAGGFTISRNWLPDSTGLQDRVVALIETAGLAPSPRTELDTAGLQVLVRGASLISTSSAFTQAEATAQAAKAALHGVGPVTSSTGRYYPGIRALQEPFLLHLDEKKRPVMACNYLVWRSRT